MPPDHGIVNIQVKGCFPQQKEYFDESINHLESEKLINTEMSQTREYMKYELITAHQWVS